MKKNNEKEVLDFCRVKKIFEKGFGFLTSLYHFENVFFHFSKIRDPEKREALTTLKRGVVSIFYTSILKDGKRKVDKIWLDISQVPQVLIPDFVERLILELKDGRTNPFEIMDALHQLRNIEKLSDQDYTNIINSEKILKNPSILLKLLSDNESDPLNELRILLESSNDKSISEITDDLLQIFKKRSK